MTNPLDNWKEGLLTAPEALCQLLDHAMSIALAEQDTLAQKNWYRVGRYNGDLKDWVYAVHPKPPGLLLTREQADYLNKFMGRGYQLHSDIADLPEPIVPAEGQ